MPKKKLPDLLTLRQCADFLGTSRQALYEAIERGRLKPIRYGHVSLIPRAAAEAYKKTRRPGGPRPAKKRSK